MCNESQRITLQMAAIIWCPYLLFSRCVISLSRNSLRSRLMPSRRFLTTSPSWSAWGQVWASTSMTNNSRAEPISTAASPCYNPALLPCVPVLDFYCAFKLLSLLFDWHLLSLLIKKQIKNCKTLLILFVHFIIKVLVAVKIRSLKRKQYFSCYCLFVVMSELACYSTL